MLKSNNLDKTCVLEYLFYRAPSVMYGNQLDGLCGNCNDEKEDDFRTISGEIVFTETIFFTSWVIYDYSLDAVIIDTGRLSSAYTLI